MATADSSTNLRRDNTTDGVNASIETLPASTPSTLGYDESTFVENKWGYRIANSSINPSLITTNYFPFASGSTILENTTSTNEDKATLSFASKINYNLPAGSYATELIMNATANPIVYDIEYWDLLGISSTDPTMKNDAGLTWNNPTSGTAKEASYTKIGTQASTTNTGASITIDPKDLTSGSPITNPTRHTYTFAGWCLDTTNPTNRAVNNTVTADQDSNNGNKVTAYHNPSTVCNGTIYQTGDYLPLTPNNTNNINLYAIWTPTTFEQAGVNTNDTMQTMTAAKCEATTPNQFTTMTDSRNLDDINKTYTIIKLMDGNCWMADNLDLNLNNASVRTALKGTDETGANTNAPKAALNALRSGGGSDSNGYAQAQWANGAADWTTTNSLIYGLVNRNGRCDPAKNSSYQCLSPYQGTAGSTTDGNYTYDTVIDNYGTAPASGSSGVATIVYDFGPGGYRIGTYYNYCAASAGSYCYSSSYAGNANATSDICPKGWKIPSGQNETILGSYAYLRKRIGDTITTTPNSATNLLSVQTMLSNPVSGSYNSGTAYSQGAQGNFWSSTYNRADVMYVLYIGGTIVSPSYAFHRYTGASIRCIAQNY